LDSAFRTINNRLFLGNNLNLHFFTDIDILIHLKKDLYVNQDKTPDKEINKLFGNFLFYFGGRHVVVAIAQLQFIGHLARTDGDSDYKPGGGMCGMFAGVFGIVAVRLSGIELCW